MKFWPTKKQQSIPIGTAGSGLFQRVLSLPLQHVRSHTHVIGVSGSGKSRWLARYYLNLLRHGLAATLLDPHGELAQLVLAQLVHDGFYQRPDAYQRLLYLDLPAAERAGRFLPFNVLAAPGAPHTVASNVKEAMHRAWPALGGGSAPMFDTLVQDGCKVLIANALPLTGLYRLLTDTSWRTQLLAAETDPDVVAFFRDQFDRLAPRDQADQAGAALRRAHLLTFSPVLKYSLGQRGMALDWRGLMDGGRSCIINLNVEDREAARLLGCLLTVGAEHAALARGPAASGRPTHHLVIDEFANFTAQSGAALAAMLSQTRKHGLFVVMAHQDWAQVDDPRLRGAMSNVGVEVAFRLDRDDARYTASKIFRVDPRTVRQDVTEEESESAGMAEQWETYVQALQDLPPRQAFIRPPQGGAVKVHSLPMPDPVVDPARLAEVEARYLDTYFRDQASIEDQLTDVRVQWPVPTTRRVQRLVPAATPNRLPPVDEGD